MQYRKVQKSSWNEPYSSSSFTKQSCSKMALYRWIRTESRWNKKLISLSSPDWSASLPRSHTQTDRADCSTRTTDVCRLGCRERSMWSWSVACAGWWRPSWAPYSRYLAASTPWHRTDSCSDSSAPSGLQSTDTITCRRLGMSVLCGILEKKYADRINAKHAAEICGNVAQNCLQPTTSSRSTGSGHMDGAILLATRWSR